MVFKFDSVLFAFSFVLCVPGIPRTELERPSLRCVLFTDWMEEDVYLLARYRVEVVGFC